MGKQNTGLSGITKNAGIREDFYRPSKKVRQNVLNQKKKQALSKEAIGLAKAMYVRNARMLQADQAEKNFRAEANYPYHSREKYMRAQAERNAALNKARRLRSIVSGRIDRKIGSALKMVGLHKLI